MVFNEKHARHIKNLEDNGLPAPTGVGAILNVRWLAAQADWYVQTEQGWFWFDERDRKWKKTLYGPQ
jgi:hypothetical protein